MSRRSPRTRVLIGHHTGTEAMVAKVAAGAAAKQETGSGQVLLSHQSSRQDLSALFLPSLSILTERELFLWRYNLPSKPFSIQKSKCCRFWTFILFFFRRFSKKNLEHDFPKMRGGGGQRPFGIFPKIHPFW